MHPGEKIGNEVWLGALGFQAAASRGDNAHQI